jgi:acylphosphatase
MVHRRVVVRGDVQGVGYRWSARQRATELGVSGFVQNQADGSVVAELRGADSAVDAMVEWMRSGPPGARVASLESSELPPGEAAEFEIRR